MNMIADSIVVAVMAQILVSNLRGHAQCTYHGWFPAQYSCNVSHVLDDRMHPRRHHETVPLRAINRCYIIIILRCTRMTDAMVEAIVSLYCLNLES